MAEEGTRSSWGGLTDVWCCVGAGEYLALGVRRQKDVSQPEELGRGAIEPGGAD